MFDPIKDNPRTRFESRIEMAASLPWRTMLCGGMVGFFVAVALFAPDMHWSMRAFMVAGALAMLACGRWVIKTDSFDSGIAMFEANERWAAYEKEEAERWAKYRADSKPETDRPD